MNVKNCRPSGFTVSVVTDSVAIHFYLTQNHLLSLLQASLTELESEVSVLREGLKGVEKELSFHKSRNEGGASDPSDKFVNVISEFVTVASCKFSDLEDAVKDMKVEVRMERESILACVFMEHVNHQGY